MKSVYKPATLVVSIALSISSIIACSSVRTNIQASKSSANQKEDENRPSRVPAVPYPIKHVQRNGDTLAIRLYGDEHHHWAETVDGYLLKLRKDGAYEYAFRNEAGDLITTGIIATDADRRDAKTVEAIAKCKQP